MNFKKAVEIVKERCYWKVLDVDWQKKIVRLEGLYGNLETYNAKKLISFARCFTSECGRSYKKNVKYFGRKKNRRETRDLINKEEFDKIPQQGRCKDEDVWSWD